MKAKKVVALEVVEIETGKVVETVEVYDKPERMIDRVEMGMLRNMDLDRYFVRRKMA